MCAAAAGKEKKKQLQCNRVPQRHAMNRVVLQKKITILPLIHIEKEAHTQQIHTHTHIMARTTHTFYLLHKR